MLAQPRDLVWREDGCYRRASYTPFQGFGPVGDCRPSNMDNPLVRTAIRRDPRLQKFLKWSILPQADVVRARCNARVAIGDARYGEGRRSRLARETLLPLAGGGCARPLALDVTAPETFAERLKSLPEDFAAIDILVNNAGVTADNLLLRMSLDDWERVLRTNLTGAYALTKEVIRGMMKKRWGRVINISSVVGLMGNAGQANYAASKAGLIGFSKSLAREVGSRGITVNVVAPGFIETDMTRKLSEEQRSALMGPIALGRLGSVDDVAAAVVFLASSGAAYVTGETLHVNGGMYMP